MGMPAFVYRLYFWSHGLKNLRRNILAFCGVKPIYETALGSIESTNARTREGYLHLTRYFGRKGI